MAAHITGPLHWEQLGQAGPPLVFVHPNPLDHSCWLYQMAHCSTWFRTIGVDLPGYGRSPAATEGLTMPDVAQACWEAVDEATGDPAILVGLSVGSNVVMHMARQRPARTRAIILSGWGYHPVKTFAYSRIESYQREGIAFRREHAQADFSPAFRQTPLGQYFVDLFTERNARVDVATIITMFRALAEPDPDWLFDLGGIPMLTITGSEDAAHPAAFALQERVQGSELVTIQDAGHACNMEKPWEFDAHLLGFLAGRGLLDRALVASP